MSELTVTEISWLKRLQKVLDSCPSPERIGFFTIGDREISLYDRTRQREIENALDGGGEVADFCQIVDRIDAGFYQVVRFPSQVHSTSG